MYKRECIEKVNSFLIRTDNIRLSEILFSDSFYTAIVKHIDKGFFVDFEKLFEDLSKQEIKKKEIITLCQIIDYINYFSKNYIPIISPNTFNSQFRFVSIINDTKTDINHSFVFYTNFLNIEKLLKEKLCNYIDYEKLNTNKIFINKSLQTNISLKLDKNELLDYLTSNDESYHFFGKENDLDFLTDLLDSLTNQYIELSENKYIIAGIDLILSLLSTNIKTIKIDNIVVDNNLKNILKTYNIVKLYQLSKLKNIKIETIYLKELLSVLLTNDLTEPINLQNYLLGTLKDKEYNYIKLRYVDELTYNEIGNILGVTRAGSQAAIQKALNKIRINQRYIDRFYNQTLLFRSNDLFICSNIFEKTGIWENLFLDLWNIQNYKNTDVYIIDLSKQKCNESFNNEKTIKTEYEFPFIANLPNIIKKQELNKYIEIIQEDEVCYISTSDILKIININYRDYKTIISKTKLNNDYFLRYILEAYYPNGLNVYDNSELMKIKKLLIERFNLEVTDYSVRYLSNRITRMCSLIGRGIWKVNSNIELDDGIIKLINGFVANYPISSVPIKSVYEYFSATLLEYGINNKYAFQGVLKKIINSNYKTTKDYIYTDDSQTFVSHIEKFIKNASILATKDVLEKEFPGFQIGSMQRVMETTSVVNMNGYYASMDNFYITENEKTQLRTELKNIVNDESAHNVKNIYYKFKNMFNDLFNRIGINHYLQLYYIINKLFEDDFEFLRPFIAKIGIEIQDKETQLVELIIKENGCTLNRIRELRLKVGYFMESIMDFVIRNNDRIIFENENYIKPIEQLNIDDEKIVNIDNILEEFMLSYDYRPLKELTYFKKIKDLINCPNEWLLYSIISSYSIKYKVFKSSNKMSNTILILAKEDFDLSEAKDILVNIQYTNIELDDILDIEDLE